MVTRTAYALHPDKIVIVFEDYSTPDNLPGCSCVFPGVKALLVARNEGIFAYDPDEGNLS